MMLVFLRFEKRGNHPKIGLKQGFNHWEVIFLGAMMRDILLYANYIQVYPSIPLKHWKLKCLSILPAMNLVIYNITGWWFGIFLIFQYIGNDSPNMSQLTNIFQRGWNHQTDYITTILVIFGSHQKIWPPDQYWTALAESSLLLQP